MKNLPFLFAFCALALPTVCVADPYPQQGLVGLWAGNGNANDSSFIGNNGVFGGLYGPGSPDGGQSFDLSTAKVFIPDNPAYDFQSYAGWSVGFWFNPNGHSIQNAVFLGQDNGPGYQPKWFVDYGYTVFSPNNSFVLHVNDYNQERLFVLSDAQFNISGWNQLTITIDNMNSGKVSFYLNGDAIGTEYLGDYVLQPTAPLIFGFAEGFNYSGLISDVFLYNRELTALEVDGIASAVPEVAGLAPLAFFGIALGAILRKQKAARRAAA